MSQPVDTPNRPATLQYRCRLCGKVFERGRTTDAEGPMFGAIYQSIDAPTMTVSHECSVKMTGVADFAGVQFDEPVPTGA